METVPLRPHKKGTTWGGLRGVLRDGDGNPIDLTDASIVMKVRESLNAAQAVLEITTTAGGWVIDDAEAGMFHVAKRVVSLPRAPHDYFADIRITLANGDTFVFPGEDQYFRWPHQVSVS